MRGWWRTVINECQMIIYFVCDHGCEYANKDWLWNGHLIRYVFSHKNVQMLLNRSAHPSSIGAFININLEGVIEINWWVFNLESQYFSNCIPDRQWSLIVDVLLQLEIHKELHVSLAINKVLGHNIICPIWKILVGDGLNFKGEVKVG